MATSSPENINLRLLCSEYEKEIEFEVNQDIKLTQLT